MPISQQEIQSPEHLSAAVVEAGTLLQMAHDYIGANPQHSAIVRLRFPRGYLRTAANHRQKISFVEDRKLRANISYALMTHDLLRWMFAHTDISGQAREMLIKEAICLVGNVCESLSLRPGYVGLGRKKSFASRIDRYVELEVISAELSTDLIWLWDKRNQEHIADIPFSEWSHYSREDWLRSVKAYREFRDKLADRYAAQK